MTYYWHGTYWHSAFIDIVFPTLNDTVSTTYIISSNSIFELSPIILEHF